MPDKKLTRSSPNRMLAGVCGGLAEYFNVDPTLMRIAFIVLTFLTGGTWLLVYVAMAIVMPAPNLQPTLPPAAGPITRSEPPAGTGG